MNVRPFWLHEISDHMPHTCMYHKYIKIGNISNEKSLCALHIAKVWKYITKIPTKYSIVYGIKWFEMETNVPLDLGVIVKKIIPLHYTQKYVLASVKILLCILRYPSVKRILTELHISVLDHSTITSQQSYPHMYVSIIISPSRTLTIFQLIKRLKLHCL